MSVEERLNALEKKVRLYLWLFLGACTLSVILAGTSAFAIQQKEVRANRFVLEDNKGETSALLYMAKNGPSLTLYDLEGNPRVMLSVRESGPALTLLDETGEKSVGLSQSQMGLLLSVWGGPGLGYACISVTKDGPQISLDDKSHHRLWEAP